jgi:hypothetical protein
MLTANCCNLLYDKRVFLFTKRGQESNLSANAFVYATNHLFSKAHISSVCHFLTIKVAHGPLTDGEVEVQCLSTKQLAACCMSFFYNECLTFLNLQSLKHGRLLDNLVLRF